MINWDVRYKNVVNFIDEHKILGTILEVGSGPVGVSRYVSNNIIGLEYNNVTSESNNLTIHYGDVRDINFNDGEFELVLCSDVLEHLSSIDRQLAITECVRVSSRFVLIQNPTGFAAFEADKFLKNSFDYLSWSPPKWLTEHLENGFPITSSITSVLFECGFRPNIFVNEYVLQHYAALFLDIFYKGAPDFEGIVRSKAHICDIKPNPADVPYSLLFVLDKKLLNCQNPHKFDSVILQLNPVKSSEVTVFSVFDRHFDFADRFKSIIPFYVNLLDSDTTKQTLRNPIGTFELFNCRSSELTAISYILRNKLYGDVIGFCHYRRYINLYEDQDNVQSTVDVYDFEKWRPYVDDPQMVCHHLNDYHLLIAEPLDLNNTVENHYCIYHYSQDYYNLFNAVSTNHPYLVNSFIQSMDSTRLFASNLIIGRAPLVQYIFDIIFDVLEFSAASNNVESRTKYQTRDIAFLSERIFDVVIRFLISHGFRVKFLNRLNLNI